MRAIENSIQVSLAFETGKRLHRHSLAGISVPLLAKVHDAETRQPNSKQTLRRMTTLMSSPKLSTT
jgi:hypothetical protein